MAGKFILSDLSRYPDQTNKNKELVNLAIKRWPKGWLGYCIAIPAENQYTVLDFTGPPGSSMGIFYSMLFQFRKWMYNVKKIRETIEISPVHQQYYQIVHKQKEELENKIKQGLALAASAVGDLELLEHDMRKYQEFINYFGLIYDEDKNELLNVKELVNKFSKYIEKAEKYGEDKAYEKIEKDNRINQEEKLSKNIFKEIVKLKKENKIEPNEHSLKAIFVDQVDFHAGSTGQGAGRLSMSFMQQNNIMPTIVQDFFAMKSEKDLEEDKMLKNLPTVEKNMLRTKWRAYEEWRKMFEAEVKKRYINIKMLVRSREASVDRYRNWLKPYITRHELLEEEHAEGTAGKRSLFVHLTGQAISYNSIEMMAWRDFMYPELQKTPGELFAKKPIDPYDDWTKENLIWHHEHGLVKDFPWITEEWIKEKLEGFKKPGGGIEEEVPYYSVCIFTLDRTNIKMASGEEYEDADFGVNMFLFSQNAMFAKLLEIEAREEEMNRKIDELLGIQRKFKGRPFETHKKKKPGPVKKFNDFFNLNFTFQKKGPYESDFVDRITRGYLKSMGGRFNQIMSAIKQKTGYGQP
jgi:hypothetical protein